MLAKRQDCTSICSSLEPALACTNGTCLCPILNAAGPQTISNCANCLQGIPEFGAYAGFLPVLGEVCSACQTPCADLLSTTLSQIEACNGTILACACGILQAVPSDGLASCNTCLQANDPTDSSKMIGFEQQCGISVGSGTPSANSGTATSTGTATATGTTTPTGSITSGPAAKTTTSGVPTATTSGGRGLTPGALSFGVLASIVALLLIH